jgi:TolA-binding protein
MNKWKMKRVKEILSEKEIRDYLDKNTPAEKVHSIKEIVSSDSFYAAAMEGYEKFPEEIKKISRVKNSVANKLFKNNFSYLYLTAAVVTILVISFLFFSAKDSQDAHKVEKTEVVLPETKPLIVGHENEKEFEIVKEDKNQFQESNLSSVSKANTSLNKSNFEENIARGIAQLKIINPPIPYSFELKENKNLKNNSGYNFPVDYMRDFKIADYTKNEMRKQERPFDPSSSIEAQYSNKSESAKNNQTTIQISYLDFLNETMGHFIQGDYKAAIIGFKTIEQNYPEDLNAWFYCGLSYYHLGHTDKAIPYFEKTENNYINIFNEEAQWYRALSLELKNDKENAFLIYEKIIQKKGFYAEKASKKLSTYKN